MDGEFSAEDRRLGMGARITRRDFLNGGLLGGGSALLGATAPGLALARGVTASDPFTGYGGVGDYARANGNTRAVLEASHRIRDGAYARPPAIPDSAVEDYDLIIVGGGLTGLTAAWEYAKATGGGKRCLILENHPIFGGEARQNDFLVDGHRLTGPQASNDFLAPEPGSGTQIDHFFTAMDIPRDFTWQSWDPGLKPLRFALDNYTNMDGLGETLVDVGYCFEDGLARAPRWINNIWADDLARTPFDPRVRAQLLRWRRTTGETGTEDPRLLDTMTYQHYLEVVKGYAPDVTRFAQPVVGLLGGVGADAVSARVGHHYVTDARALTASFPGGNSLFGRYLVKALIPDALAGGKGFADVAQGGVDFTALDRPGQPTRIRVNSTVFQVTHTGGDPGAGVVEVSYERGGTYAKARASAVILAIGGWVARHIATDLPAELRAAYAAFNHAPALVVNVALHNWRFLYKLGAPAVRWMDDGSMFGFCANIRRGMVIGDQAPPLHPDKPALLTFYMGLYTPDRGHDAATQGALGRARLLATSYADYERIIRTQMTRMFGGLGFDARRDIAGIVLNRWGHARVIQPPGFYYGRDGQPSPREVVAKGYGRIAIAHAELNGAQNYTGAFQHGKRAAEQVLAFG